MNQTRAFHPSLRQLRAFLAVYELGKLTAAAERMSVTPSAISVLVRQLEDGLGARLFDRTTRSLQATAAAHEAVDTAMRILRDVESLGTGLRELTTLRRGRVSIAITPTLGPIVLPDVMRAFAQRHPGIHVVVDDCAPDRFISRVVGGHVDLGIGTPEGAAADVEVSTLMRDHLAVVCRTDHPLAKSQTVRWTQLAHHPVITVRPGYGIRPLIDAAAMRAGVQLEIANEVAFLSTAIWMAASGHGISIMPSAYATHAADKNLVCRALSAPKVRRDVALVIQRGRSLSPAATEFVRLLKSHWGSAASTGARRS